MTVSCKAARNDGYFNLVITRRRDSADVVIHHESYFFFPPKIAATARGARRIPGIIDLLLSEG